MLRSALLWLWVAPALVLGCVIGFGVCLAVIFWHALVRGYIYGRGLIP